MTVLEIVFIYLSFSFAVAYFYERGHLDGDGFLCFLLIVTSLPGVLVLKAIICFMNLGTVASSLFNKFFINLPDWKFLNWCHAYLIFLTCRKSLNKRIEKDENIDKVLSFMAEVMRNRKYNENVIAMVLAMCEKHYEKQHEPKGQ